MKKEPFGAFRKVLFPFLAIYCLLEIFQQGHSFGQWLYVFLH